MSDDLIKTIRPTGNRITLTVDEGGIWRDSFSGAWAPISAERFDKGFAQKAIERAIEEFREEKFREAVDREKKRLLMPWWQRLFPWRIKINIDRR